MSLLSECGASRGGRHWSVQVPGGLRDLAHQEHQDQAQASRWESNGPMISFDLCWPQPRPPSPPSTARPVRSWSSGPAPSTSAPASSSTAVAGAGSRCQPSPGGRTPCLCPRWGSTWTVWVAPSPAPSFSPTSSWRIRGPRSPARLITALSYQPRPPPSSSTSSVSISTWSGGELHFTLVQLHRWEPSWCESGTTSLLERVTMSPARSSALGLQPPPLSRSGTLLSPSSAQRSEVKTLFLWQWPC